MGQTVPSMAAGRHGGNGRLVVPCAAHRKRNGLGDAMTPCHSMEGRTAQGKHLTCQIKKKSLNARIILHAQNPVYGASGGNGPNAVKNVGRMLKTRMEVGGHGNVKFCDALQEV